MRSFALALAAAAAFLTFDLSGARADDRCTGTLCDLYYANRPAPSPSAAQPAATSAAAQPAGVPAGATAMTVPTGGINGGGILNFFRSSPPSGSTPAATQAGATPGQPASKPFMYLTEGKQYDRCTGTLCDLYYGSSAGKAAPAAGTQQASAVPGKASPSAVPAAPAPPTAEQIALAKAAQQRRAAQEAEQQARAKCRVANDPWHCMR